MYMWGLDPYNQKWMLVKPAPGKRLDQTAAYRHVQHSPQHCWALVNHAMDLATASILSTYQHSHWLHQDPVLGNVFFDDNVSRASLIDWGCAAQPRHAVSMLSCFAAGNRSLMDNRQRSTYRTPQTSSLSSPSPSNIPVSSFVAARLRRWCIYL